MIVPNHQRWIPIIVAMLMVLILTTIQNAPAQTSPEIALQATQGTNNAVKIAFVGMQQVIATCDEGKDENAKFQQWAEKRRSELQGLQKEIDTLKNQMDLQGAKLTDEARNELSDTIESKEALLQRSQQDSQKEADKRQQRLIDSIYRKAAVVIDKVATDRKLDCIFFIDQNRDAYIKPALIITDEVVKAYNATYPIKDGQPTSKPQATRLV